MHWLASLWTSWGRLERCAVVGCVALILPLSGARYIRQTNAEPLPPFFEEAPQFAGPSKTGPGEQGKKKILVHVVGAVRKPGLVELPALARVVQAIERAGGALPTADVQSINLAAILKDGQQIRVPLLVPVVRLQPSVASPLAPQPRAPKVPVRTGPVNVNTASAQELEALPGVGPAIAARIVAYRAQKGRFERVEDLDEVNGIGPKKLESLRGFVKF